MSRTTRTARPRTSGARRVRTTVPERRRADLVARRALSEGRAEPGFPAGWHPDPYGRWRARYWDGFRWTDRVASPGPDGRTPVYGRDGLGTITITETRAEGHARVDLLEAMWATEMARLRAEADAWRGLAKDLAEALHHAHDTVAHLASTLAEVSTTKAEAPAPAALPAAADPVPPPVAPASPASAPEVPDVVMVPPAIRVAALHDIATLDARRPRSSRGRGPRWWRNPIAWLLEPAPLPFGLGGSSGHVPAHVRPDVSARRRSR